MSSASPEVPRVEVPCDRAHLDQLRAPTSDVAVPSCTAALESIAALLSHQLPRQRRGQALGPR